MKHWPVWALAGAWALGAVPSAHAQYSLGTPGFLGIAGGATLTDLGGVGNSSTSRWGGMAGLLLGRRTSTGTAGMLEVNWSQQGGGDTRLEYVSIPLTFGAITGRGMTRARPYIGVSIDLKSGCSSPVPGECNAASGSQWALPLGFTVGRVTTAGTFVGVDVRYAVPLSHAFDNSAVVNRSWQFRLVLAKPSGRR